MTYGMLAAGSCLLTDVVKSGGYKFESLGIVRDGSESTSAKNVYKKGYHVTEACVLTTGNHPVSIFSKVHSSAEKGYKSANTVTFEAMERGSALFEKATFCMDRGYDDNKMFLKLDSLIVNLAATISYPHKTNSFPIRDTVSSLHHSSVFQKFGALQRLCCLILSSQTKIFSSHHVFEML